MCSVVLRNSAAAMLYGKVRDGIELNELVSEEEASDQLEDPEARNQDREDLHPSELQSLQSAWDINDSLA